MTLHLSIRRFALETLYRFISFSLIYAIHIATVNPSLRLLDALSPSSPLYHLFGLSRWLLFLTAVVIFQRRTKAQPDCTAYFTSLFAAAAALLFIQDRFPSEIDSLFSQLGFSGQAVLALTAFSPLVAVWVSLEIMGSLLSRLDMCSLRSILRKAEG